MRAAVLRQPLSRLVRREVVQPIVLRGRNTWQVGSRGIFACACCRPCLGQDVLACTKICKIWDRLIIESYWVCIFAQYVTKCHYGSRGYKCVASPHGTVPLKASSRRAFAGDSESDRRYEETGEYDTQEPKLEVDPGCIWGYTKKHMKYNII